MAEEFLEAYNAVASQWPGDSVMELLDPKLFLLCHALELSMKGWLVLREGLPVSLSPAMKDALKQAGKPIPKTLKDYGHHLAKTAKAAGVYYKPLLEHMDTIEHLTISYWGSDTMPEFRSSRNYEYPEGNWRVSYMRPSELAVLVKACVDELLTAAVQGRSEAMG